MAYITHWEDRGIYWRYTGMLTLDEMHRANDELIRDPRFDDITYQISDFLEVEGIDLPTDKMESVTKQLACLDLAAAKTNPHVKAVIIVDSEEFHTLAEIYAEIVNKSPWQVYITDTMQDARRWIAEK